jgi:hypothetical protein
VLTAWDLKLCLIWNFELVKQLHQPQVPQQIEAKFIHMIFDKLSLLKLDLFSHQRASVSLFTIKQASFDQNYKIF